MNERLIMELTKIREKLQYEASLQVGDSKNAFEQAVDIVDRRIEEIKKWSKY